MKLFYYQSKLGNFGDDLNPWLWDKLLPEFFDEDERQLFVGIGTLLSPRIPAADKTIVFGSGVGYGPPPKIDKSWDIICVRGPVSAKILDLPRSLAVADPAILISLYEKYTTTDFQQISFMPHHLSNSFGDWKTVCEMAGIQYIDARMSVSEVVQRLKNTKLLIAEAMHGAIVADSLRIPWIAIHSYEHILSLKWQDWMESLSLDNRIQYVNPVWYGERGKPISQKLKIKIKRNLAHIGIKPKNWVTPLPPASSTKEMEIAANNLIKISTMGIQQLSEDVLLTQKKEQLLELIGKVKSKYKV